MQSLQLTIGEENLELHLFDDLLLSWTFAIQYKIFKMIFHINVIVHDTVIVGVSNQ